MKGLHLPAFIVVLGSCSATAKQDSTEPQPTSGQPGSPTPTTAAPATTAPPTYSTSSSTGSMPTPTGRSKAAIVCPSFQIKAPDVVTSGRSGRVTLIVTDASRALTYNWQVSAGAVESGQGTTTVSVQSAGLAGSSITATVEVGNLPLECQTRAASATFLVGG